jgi:flavin reductase ActVB
MTSPEGEPSMFRDAMARFPSGVVITTARDENGEAHGFTASSFCSVSADPPLVLVCLAKSANCHPVFTRCRRFAISIVAAGQVHHAIRFATKGARKFTDVGFTTTATGQPSVAGALATLDCVVAGRHPAGDHTIIVGDVQQIALGDHEPPAVYYRRAFHSLVATPTPSHGSKP